MPNKSKGSGGASQPPDLDKSIIKSAKVRNANLDKRLSEQDKAIKARVAARDKQRKIADKDYKKLLRDTAGKGIYDPKSVELTPYRRKRLRAIKRTYGEMLSDKYFFVPIPKDNRRSAIERANNLKIETTKTGLFIPKDGHKRASLKYSKKYDEFHVILSGKTKRGPNSGKTYKTNTPLASIDELEIQRERLRRAAKRLGANTGSKRYAFQVHENGIDGYSHSVFATIEDLIKYLDTYNKKGAQSINFYRHIKVVQTESSTEWVSEHPTFAPGKTGQRARGQYYNKGYKGKRGGLDTRRSK